MKESTLNHIKANFENTQIAVTIFDHSYEVCYVNSKARRNSMDVFAKEISIGDSIFNYVKEEELERFKSAVRGILEQGNHHKHINQFCDRQGKPHWFSYELMPYNMDEEIMGVIMLIEEITEAVENRASLQTFSQLFDNLSEKVCIFNQEGHFIWCNQHQCQGKQGSQHCFFQVNLDQEKSLPIREIIAKVDQDKVWEHSILKVNPSGHSMIERLKVLPLEGGNERKYVGISLDETELVSTRHELSIRKRYDPLTEAVTRQHINSEITRLIQEKIPFGLFHVDIDGFRLLNKLKGYNFGDALLQHLYLYLVSLDEACMVARSHGDNFMVLVLLDNLGELRRFADKIVATEKDHLKYDDVMYSISVGAGMYPHHASDARALMQGIELAKEKAKEVKLNSYDLYGRQEKDEGVVAYVKEKLVTLSTEEFYLEFQPIYATSTFKTEGVEALIRWKTDKFGQISPGLFIPIAEKNGVISTISLWVVRSCMELLEQHPDFFRNKYIAVNLSVLDIMNQDFMQRIVRLFLSHQELASKIEIELTESYYFEKMDLLRERIDTLRGLGVKVAVDDFGTGFSTLEKIANISFDKLKIDQNFVRDLTIRPQHEVILKMISTLSKELGLRVTVEGIETEEQMNLLAKYGFQAYQGFYLSRPKPLTILLQAM